MKLGLNCCGRRRFVVLLVVGMCLLAVSVVSAQQQEQEKEPVVAPKATPQGDDTVAQQAEVTASGEPIPVEPETLAVVVECDCTAEVAAKDCSPDVDAAVQPLLLAQQDLEKTLATRTEELDEIIEERNRLLEQIKQLRESLHASRTEQESLRTSLQSTKSAKDEVQQRLVTCQSQVAAIKNELDNATREIQKLNHMSFIVQFRSEVVSLFDGMVNFAKNIVKRH